MVAPNPQLALTKGKRQISRRCSSIDTEPAEQMIDLACGGVSLAWWLLTNGKQSRPSNPL